jgi:hypothetical protein
MRRALLSLAAAALLLGAACASVPLPDREGVALYRAKCAGCHRPYAPSEIKAEKWDATFREMKKRAHLNDEEALVIRRYVEVDLVASHAPGAAR